jgi:hypothetical protein
LNIICKYTTLQLCRIIGEESIGFSWCIFCCFHHNSHLDYNNPHYTNSHIVPMSQITKSKGNQKCSSKFVNQFSYSFSRFLFFWALQCMFTQTMCLFIHNKACNIPFAPLLKWQNYWKFQSFIFKTKSFIISRKVPIWEMWIHFLITFVEIFPTCLVKFLIWTQFSFLVITSIFSDFFLINFSF